MPSFYCKANEISEKLSDDSSKIIEFLHNILFDKNNTTRYSDPQIMGFNDQKIFDKLVFDIPFQLFSITINKLSIIIHSINIFSVKT